MHRIDLLQLRQIGCPGLLATRREGIAFPPVKNDESAILRLRSGDGRADTTRASDYESDFP